MKKLIYADTFSIGAYHETFNASSLRMFAAIYSGITYYASKGSKDNIKSVLGTLPQNVRYKPLFIFSGIGKKGNFFRHLSSMSWNIFFVLKQRRNEVLYFNCNSLWGLRIINHIIKLRKTDVIITCHGELEFIQKGIKLNALSQAGLNLFTNKDWEIAESLFFCVLSNTIQKNLHNIVEKRHLKKFFSYEHSFIPHSVDRNNSNDDKVFRIGTVGTIREFKGLSQLLFIGNSIKARQDIEFYALGRIACDPKILTEAGIKYIPNSEIEYVSKYILNSYIDKMDCLLFAYPIDNYKLTASGALFDAIDREKIILSLHNDYFDGVCERSCFGKLFSSVEEMVEYINEGNISERNNIDYYKNKNALSPEASAVELKKTLANLSLL